MKIKYLLLSTLVIPFLAGCQKQVYDPTVEKVTETFLNYDGSTLYKNIINKGDVASYGGQTPTKPSKDGKSYTFDGWEPALGVIEQDTTYTAKYIESTEKVKATFLNYDGTELYSVLVDYGTTPEYVGNLPTVESPLPMYTIDFDGWYPAVGPITTNTVYYAHFTEHLITFNVTFLDYDGSVLYSGKVNYGATAAYPSELPVPYKPNSEGMVYAFDGWNESLSNITCDSVFTPKFVGREYSIFTITWRNDDGSILDVQEVEGGKIPLYKDGVPSKPSDFGTDFIYYKFTGWNPSIAAATEDMTYVATYRDSYLEKNDIIAKVSGGTSVEKEAIAEALRIENRVNAGGIYASYRDTYAIYEDDSDLITLSNKIIAEVDGNKIDVALTYDLVGLGDYLFGTTLSKDNRKTNVALNFPSRGTEDAFVYLKLAGLSCGTAKLENVNIKYNFKLIPTQYIYASMTLDEIYSVTHEQYFSTMGVTYPETFDIIDYDQRTPYYRSNNPESDRPYLYVQVKGKIVYIAPDGNYALLANGDKAIEVYAGAAMNLREDEFPYLQNKYVEIYGNMGHYSGNMQLCYVTRIRPCSPSEITEPTINPEQITEETIKGFKVEGYESQLQTVDGLMNAIRSVRGTYVEGSLKSNGSSVNEMTSSNSRYTFELQVGEEQLTVAYDYHTDKNGDLGIFSKVKEIITSKKTVTLVGSMRYNVDHSYGFNPYATRGGHWTIVPFDGNLITFAE